MIEGHDDSFCKGVGNSIGEIHSDSVFGDAKSGDPLIVTQDNIVEVLEQQPKVLDYSISPRLMFRQPQCSLTTVLLFLVVLFANRAIAQSLAILLNGTNKASLEATSPVNVGYRFQASVDHENWEDISDQASGSLSYWIDATKDQKRFFRLRTWATEDAPLTLVMVGDSTVADFAANSGKFYGWGQGMYEYLKPNVQVINFASPAQSSKSFLVSIERDHLVLLQPDFVLVQFGMMDTWEEESLY